MHKPGDSVCPCSPCTECDNSTTPTGDDLHNILTRYEGAVGECEREGNDSAEAVKELEEARAELMKILRQARAILEAQ